MVIHWQPTTAQDHPAFSTQLNGRPGVSGRSAKQSVSTCDGSRLCAAAPRLSCNYRRIPRQRMHLDAARDAAELKEALDLGITLFAGEAEGRFDRILQAASRDSSSRCTILYRTCQHLMVSRRRICRNPSCGATSARWARLMAAADVRSVAASARLSMCRAASRVTAAPRTSSA